MTYIKFSRHERLEVDKKTSPGLFELLVSKGFVWDALQIEGRESYSMYMPDISKWKKEKREAYKLRFKDLA